MPPADSSTPPSPSAVETEQARTIKTLEAERAGCESIIEKKNARIAVIDTQLAALKPKE